MDKRSVRRLLRLGFLSPRIIEAIAEGHQPPDLTVFSLMRRVDLPLLWNAGATSLTKAASPEVYIFTAILSPVVAERFAARC
jgi:hypothetical protein